MRAIVNVSDYTIDSATEITINDNVSFVSENIAYIFNLTQDVLYHAPAKKLVNDLSVSGTTITLDGVAIVAGDELHIQLWDAVNYDQDTRSDNISDITRIDNQTTNFIELVSADTPQSFTDGWVDFGDVISAEYYNKIRAFLKIHSGGDSEGLAFRIVDKLSSTGTDDYIEIVFAGTAANEVTLGDVEATIKTPEITFGNNSKFIQCQIKCTTVGDPATTISGYYTLAY